MSDDDKNEMSSLIKIEVQKEVNSSAESFYFALLYSTDLFNYNQN